VSPRAPEDAVPSVLLTCVSGERCSVFFEPWGTEHVLSTEDWFRVESEAFATGSVEIGYVRQGIVVGFTADQPVRVTDRAGRELPI
jgi:hypothetical protein